MTEFEFICVFDVTTSKALNDSYLLDALWGQPIKLAQVASLLQNCLTINRTNLFSSKSFPLISAGPQKPQKLTALKHEKFVPKILIPC